MAKSKAKPEAKAKPATKAKPAVKGKTAAKAKRAAKAKPAAKTKRAGKAKTATKAKPATKVKPTAKTKRATRTKTTVKDTPRAKAKTPALDTQDQPAQAEKLLEKPQRPPIPIPTPQKFAGKGPGPDSGAKNTAKSSVAPPRPPITIAPPPLSVNPGIQSQMNVGARRIPVPPPLPRAAQSLNGASAASISDFSESLSLLNLDDDETLIYKPDDLINGKDKQNSTQAILANTTFASMLTPDQKEHIDKPKSTETGEKPDVDKPDDKQKSVPENAGGDKKDHLLRLRQFYTQSLRKLSHSSKKWKDAIKSFVKRDKE